MHPRPAFALFAISIAISAANAQSPPAVLKGHTEPVYRVQYTPDGKHLVTAGFDNTLRLWDAKTGKTLRVMEGHTRIVLSTAISRNGALIASGSDDNIIKLWKLPELAKQTGAVEAKRPGAKPTKKPTPNLASDLRGHGSQVLGLSFSPDGKLLASCSADKTVRLWDVAKKSQLRTLGTQPDTVYSVAFSPDGKFLATAGGDKSVRLFNVENGIELRKFTGPESAVYSVAFSPDGKKLAAGGVAIGKTRKLFVWDVGNPSPAQTIDAHPDDIYRVQFSPKGNRLLSVGYAGNVRIWDAGSGKLLFRKDLPRVLYFGAYSPQGDRIALAGSDGVVYFLDVPAGAR